jgi:hypothetical protein
MGDEDVDGWIILNWIWVLYLDERDCIHQAPESDVLPNEIG